MTFKQIDSSNYTTLNLLALGDCFLYDGRVGMVASRNGHCFYLDLATGSEFWKRKPDKGNSGELLSGYADVQIVKGEFVFEIV